MEVTTQCFLKAPVIETQFFSPNFKITLLFAFFFFALSLQQKSTAAPNRLHVIRFFTHFLATFFSLVMIEVFRKILTSTGGPLLFTYFKQ